MIRTLAQALAIFAFLMLLYADVQRLEARIEARAERERRAERADLLLGVQRTGWAK